MYNISKYCDSFGSESMTNALYKFHAQRSALHETRILMYRRSTSSHV